jgi:ubiquinone/menaquinone biosynthesis C-methylase UbiE/uncharacterized protein YbaR (Trm112 family)
MLEFVIDLLQCPACHSSLTWNISEQNGERIETAEAHCTGCDKRYPVTGGIGVFLTAEAESDDLWKQVDSELANFLQANPEVEQRLMQTPLETLAPADQFYRAMVMEERGAILQARGIFDVATTGLYTPEYLICHESQFHYLVHLLSDSTAPIIDLASGRCDLVHRMAQELSQPIIATDISPIILRRDRQWLEAFGLFEHVSLLSFDARRTPFKDGAVQVMTTNLGLANIRHPGPLLRELRRAIAGQFLAIMSFYPLRDEGNARVIQELGLADLLYRANAREQFAAAGWEMRYENICAGRAAQTPTSQILDGAGIDSLPVTETTLEWCTLLAS